VLNELEIILKKTIQETNDEALNMSSEKYRIGKIGNKVFPEKKIKDVSEIENRIPIKSYYLDIDLTVNSEYQELVVKSRENRLKDYSSSSSQGLYYKQKENKNKVNILKKDMPNSNFKYIDIGEIDEYLSARNRI